MTLTNEAFDEFTDSVRKKYNVPEIENYKHLDYKQRNRIFYEILKNHKVCVIPSPKIESYDRMPHFAIIESNLSVIKRGGRSKKGKGKE